MNSQKNQKLKYKQTEEEREYTKLENKIKWHINYQLRKNCLVQRQVLRKWDKCFLKQTGYVKQVDKVLEGQITWGKKINEKSIESLIHAGESYQDQNNPRRQMNIRKQHMASIWKIEIQFNG